MLGFEFLVLNPVQCDHFLGKELNSQVSGLAHCVKKGPFSMPLLSLSPLPKQHELWTAQKGTFINSEYFNRSWIRGSVFTGPQLEESDSANY